MIDQKELIDDFRKHNGQVTKGYFKGRNLLLLRTRGAKSGRENVAPLAYTPDDGRILVAASKGGHHQHPAWYFNLLADPVVSVELGGETFQARATPVASGAERRRLYDKHASDKPGFWEYEKKTSREIPIVILERIDYGTGSKKTVSRSP
ncbi:MAG TPA: nitroreductase/quinone reductase family protein [Candidatus Dormibacteraeota bacterium]